MTPSRPSSRGWAWSALVWLPIGWACLPAWASPGAEAGGWRLGPLRPSPALTVYVPVGEGGMHGRFVARRGWRREGDRLLIRVFDPHERLTFWQYVEPGQMQDTLGPGSSEVWGIPIAIPDTIVAPGDLWVDTDLELRGAGVHQVRVSAGTGNTAIELTFPAPVRYGVSFQNGLYYPWDPQLARAFFYIPPRAEVLQVRGQGVRILDETGRCVFPLGEADERQAVDIPLTRTEVVWTMEFGDPGRWKLAAAGFPVILCPEAATARELRASVEVLADSTVVCHRFQRRIAELLPSVLAPEKVGDTAQLLALWGQPDPGWFQEPLRNSLLLNPYGLLPTVYAALAEQNLDPSSHWSGAIGFKTWKGRAGLSPPESRWDRLRSVPGLWAGASGNVNYAQALAEAADLDVPPNPWRGRRQLRWRAAAAALRDLMTLGEDEVWRGIGADLDSYPGMLGFVVAKKHFPEFALVAPHMPEPIRAVWTEGLRRVVDRHLPDYLVTCMNQSSHYLVGWECFARGSGDPRYTDLARRYAARFARSAAPAGYFIEACGPDATYGGMQHFHLALYYRLSGDPVIREALARSYRFFNHTVAPEPAGRVVGAFNFSHRTPDGFHNEQYGGARGLVDEVLPEVGLWAPTRPPAEREAALASLRQQLGRPLPEPQGLDLCTPRFRYWTDQPNRQGTWPAQEERPFVRNLGNELIAVKRPAYYAAVYVGHPAPTEFYVRGRSVFRRPLPDRAEDAGGDPWNYYYTLHAASPLVGGGLSLFWTPAYGNVILAGNCTPLAHQGLVAVDRQADRWWEDYFATRFELDAPEAGPAVLTVHGRIEHQPLRYVRTYRFLPDRLAVELRLETDEARLTLGDLIENLPVLGGPVKPAGQSIHAGPEEPIAPAGDAPQTRPMRLCQARSRTIQVRDTLGRGVQVVLDQERPLRLCRSGMTVRGLVRFDRVEIVLPPAIERGRPVVLAYEIVPLTAPAATQAR